MSALPLLFSGFLLQLIKGSYTLRVGCKRRKKPPREVYRFGNQDEMIAKDEDNRRFILNFLNCSDNR
jgi:hypothetical protein